MSKTYKSSIAVVVVLAFMATTVLCCCVVKGALAGVQKMACSHCSSKAKSNAGSHECCFSKASPIEMVKNTATGLIHVLPLIAFTIITFIYLKPTPQLALSRYQNGPPGFVSQVPLYISQRNLRI